MDKKQIEDLLTPTFPKKHINAALDHFAGMVSEFEAGDWEPAIAKSSKFVEAVLKALFVHVGQKAPAGRGFKVDPIFNHLAQLAVGSFDDTIRLTMPRACRFVYDVASNRGARHDPDELDPNAMDANVVVSSCSWMLSEMVRYAQKGVVDVDAAKNIVESLSTRRYPLIEEMDGRVYFHHANLSATNVALLTLAYYYPRRESRETVIKTIRRHQFSAANAATALQRVKRFVDNDGHGNLRLLATGLKMAEEIMSQ